MDGDNPRKRSRTNGMVFPAAEPEYRASRQRCAEACARYNCLAEFVSPERRARLWQEIVAPLPIDIGVDRTANESQIKSQPISRKADGEADAPSIRTDSEATKASPEKPMVSGSAAGDPMDPHSSNVSQVLHGSGITSMSPNGDSAVTPPPSPESKHIPPASTIDCDQAVDGYSDVNTPPLSRKASRPELIHENVNSTPEACEEEHDPAVTNPFIVQAPYVKPPVHIDYGTNLHIGNGTFINRNFVVIDSPVCSIRIGERCLLGPSVILAAVEHPLDADERISPCGAPSFASSIEIGDECWIAAGVMVLCGVKIGSGCVIGAGSVVTKDIPDGCIAYGNPARVVRTVSPRYRIDSVISATSTDVYDAAAARLSERTSLINSHSVSKETFNDDRVLHSCPSTMNTAYTSIHLAKDLTLLALGAISLLQWLSNQI